MKEPSRVIITGATSGIGRALAIKFAKHGHRVGVTGRREDRLLQLREQFPDQIVVLAQDLAKRESIIPGLEELKTQLGGLDLFVANAGTSRRDLSLPLENELEVLDVNVVGFVTTLNWAMQCFKRQGHGHLVGMSSVAAFWGNMYNPMYNATKAFEMNYMRGLREHLREYGIPVTDVRPGFVATEMTEQNEHMFAVATPEKAAKQIYAAIIKRREIVYITKRWRYISWIMRMTPNIIYRKLAHLNKPGKQS